MIIELLDQNIFSSFRTLLNHENLRCHKLGLWYPVPGNWLESRDVNSLDFFTDTISQWHLGGFMCQFVQQERLNIKPWDLLVTGCRENNALSDLFFYYWHIIPGTCPSKVDVLMLYLWFTHNFLYRTWQVTHSVLRMDLASTCDLLGLNSDPTQASFICVKLRICFLSSI